MVSMHFNFKDVFRAPRLGFSARTIWIGAVGLFIATVVYSILGYIALLVSGMGITEIWQVHRYIPFPFPVDASGLAWYGWIIWALGVVFVIFMLYITLTAIAKVVYEYLRGDEFYEVGAAWRYAFSQWKSSFLSPITLIFFIVVLLLLGFFFGIVGRIPYVGPIIFGLLSVPIFAGAIFVVYLSVICLVAFIIVPGIVGTSKNDTFDTLFEVFSVANDQPWRFVLWEALLIVLTIVGFVVFSWFVLGGLYLTKWAVGVVAGPRHWWGDMWTNAVAYAPVLPNLGTWGEGFVEFLAPFLLVKHEFVATHWTINIGAFLMGLSFYVFLFAALGYALSIWGAGQTIIYTVLVKMKDERNLLEAKEQEEPVVEVSKEEPITEEEKVEEEKPKKKRGRPKKTEAEKKTTTKKSSAKKTTKKSSTSEKTTAKKRGRPKKKT